MNTFNRVAMYGAITALIGISGCIVPGPGYHHGYDKHEDRAEARHRHDERREERREDSRDERHCGDSDDEECHDRR